MPKEQETKSPTNPERFSSISYWFLVLFALVAGAMIIGMPRLPDSDYTVPLPAPLPTANVEGWTNTPGPLTADDLKGHWVVVDCWATWCGPCRVLLPEMAEFRERWPEVMVIGITPETSEDLETIEDTIDSVEGFTWPVAYGGEAYFEKYGIQMIPALMLYSPEGKLVVKKSHSLEEIEDILRNNR